MSARQDPLLIALRFLTRLPVPEPRSYAAELIGRSLLYYPLVGLLLGLGLYLCAWLTQNAAPPLQAALVLTAWVLASGGLHLDGLADSADAWIGGLGDPTRTLAIMKDPASGPAGVTALVLVLLLKYAALQALLAEPGWQALLWTPCLGRAVLPLLFLTTPYVRPGGLGEDLARHLPRHSLRRMLLALALLIVFTAGTTGLILLLTALTTLLGLRHALLRRLGGCTGDTAGALVELGETALLIVAALWI
jgi:adenosylcobinamide-GDP ribazoletransferase